MKELTKEIWAPIFGWEDYYEASNMGRIKSKKRLSLINGKYYGGNIIKPIKHNSGYYVANLTTPERREQVLVHRVILYTFIGECPDNMEACHNDGDRANNKLINLRWDTKKNNCADKIRHGTHQIGENNPFSKLTNKQVQEIRKSKEPGIAIAKRYGVSSSTIYRVRNYDNWNHL